MEGKKITLLAKQFDVPKLKAFADNKLIVTPTVIKREEQKKM